uniref:3'-5' exonuclease domain-containing protein n=2 Tax=Panagrolaimus sp. PS1159 TaxID=55785 RepID=A0AC35GGV0_9BILA
MEEELEIIIEKLKEVYSEQSAIEKDKLQDIEEFIKTLYLNCDEKHARILTMNLIILTHKQLSAVEDGKEDIYKEICYKILMFYQLFVYQKSKTAKLLKQITFAIVSDELWKKCLICLINLDIKHCSAQMDKLLHISKSEKKTRTEIIATAVKEMLESENNEDFYNGVKWISTFNLEKLKVDEFRNIVYKSHIHQMPEALALLLTTKRFNEEYLLSLDGCYKRLLKSEQPISEIESNFIQTMPMEALKNFIQSEAERLEVDINSSKFHVYYLKVTNELRDKFLNGEKEEFEMFALNILKSFKQFSKLHFINLLVEDPKYAYCWTKMLQLESHDIPEFVRQLGNQYEPEANEFIQSMKKRLITPVDSVETCTIFGKEYKLLMITTPKGLKDFLQKYFIDSKPDILGIDSEAYKFKLSLFQLATKDWCCIIDIFLLSPYLSTSDWTLVFQHIFDPTIIRIGFAFHADFNFIQIAFPHICDEILKEDNRKVICLSTLSKAILDDSEAKNVVFSKLTDNNMTTKSNISLSNVSKAILDIKLNKDQQSSDWNWRPLSYEQKIYAVTDAIVVILIKEKIETDLKNAFGDEKTLKIMEKGNICFGQKQKKELKIKRGNKMTTNESNISIEVDVVNEQEN